MSFEQRKNGGIFVCPVCRGALTLSGRSLLCSQNHTYDLAKSGYVNLLLSSTKSHGDGHEMLAARRAFLGKGYYAPLRRALVCAVQDCLPNGGTVLDSGCGEGYYTQALAADNTLSVYGIDVSSRAAAYSAKQPGVAGIAVASAYKLPVREASCDMVTNLFSPFCREEFARVLKDGGYLINVIPAERHLWELKCQIYDEPYENHPDDPAVEGFTFLKKIAVSDTLSLSCREDIASLFLMTPYFYHTDKKGHERARALEALEVTAAFYLLVYCKKETILSKS